MRLLADENVHSLVVERLRSAGHEVEWVAESGAGMADAAMLQRPDIAELVLITYDRDFGDLIFNHGYPAPRSILYSRLGRADPRHAADRILRLLDSGLPERHMITIARDGERMKPFPDGARNG